MAHLQAEPGQGVRPGLFGDVTLDEDVVRLGVCGREREALRLCAKLCGAVEQLGSSMAGAQTASSRPVLAQWVAGSSPVGDRGAVNMPAPAGWTAAQSSRAASARAAGAMRLR